MGEVLPEKKNEVLIMVSLYNSEAAGKKGGCLKGGKGS